mmetsp:Transcript_9796/g.13989  ORF Transcript_9796/g.13989 Transcript_9796/m.13989 type:complete len:271 (+) Transcript_9796:96-908(+)
MKTSALLFCIITAGGYAFQSAAPSSRVVISRASPLHETKTDLEDLAKKLNPLIGYYDPLGLGSSQFAGRTDEFTIGFLRHAEIKHGRVAMAAFVGYCVQSNYRFPWPMTLDGSQFPSLSLSPPEQWDVLPFAAKVQIILFVGYLEFYSEISSSNGQPGEMKHYCKGGIPGKYPSFDANPHPVPFNLYDPFNLHKNMSEEQKERRLLVEINNGRLAMFGILGFLCAQTTPGSVPLLNGMLGSYTGEVMAPFQGDLDIVLGGRSMVEAFGLS